jgi:hypothetical protein
MKPVYMPFTHLTEPTARILSALMGPVVVYQPLENRVDGSLTALADQGLIDIRTPLTGDEDRLVAALSEFTRWAGENPGRSTPGADYVGSLQGNVPYFDDSSISHIRSEIKQYKGRPAETNVQETGFSARLFLAAAEQNDRTTAHLDQDLKQFKALEQGFLDSLVEGDEADFDRHAQGSQLWPEDPGAKRTEQRIRSWATLAAADPELPNFIITTSPAVVDMLVETWGAVMPIDQLASIPLAIASDDAPPMLNPVLAELAAQDSLTGDACDALVALKNNDPDAPAIVVTLYAAIDCAPASMVRQIAPAGAIGAEKKTDSAKVNHTLIVLVEPESKSE